MYGIQRLLFRHPALDGNRSLQHIGSCDFASGNRRETALLPLVRVPPALHAAKINGFRQGFICEVHRENARLLNHVIGVALRTYGNRQHRRVRADGSRPGHREEIGMLNF